MTERLVPAAVWAGGLGTAAAAGLLCVTHAAVALAAVGAAVVLLLLAGGALTLMDYIALGAPLMFYVGGVGTLHLAVSDVFLPATVALLVVTAARRGLRLPRPMLVLVVAAMAVAGLSVVHGAATELWFDNSLAASNLLKLAVVLSYVVVATVWTIAASDRDIVRFLSAWVLIAVLCACGSVLSQVTSIALVPTDGYRSNGFFQDPNLYAGYLLVSMAVLLVLHRCHPRPVDMTAFAALALGVVTTGSRSGVAALAVLVVLAAVVVSSPVLRAASAVAVGLGAVLAYGVVTRAAYVTDVPALQRLVDSSGEVGADPRIGLWGRAIDLWEGSPWFGVGIGQFARLSDDVFGINRETGTGFVAHNTFLSFLAETGTFGFLLCVAGLVAVGVCATRITGFAREARGALVLGVVAVALQMATLNLQNVRYVWLYFGLVVGLSVRGARTPVTSGEPDGRELRVVGQRLG